MRGATLFLIGLLLIMTGCYAQRSAPRSPQASEETECRDCCEVKSRADLLKKKQSSAKAIELKTVTCDEFVAAIQAQAGKVVCVCCWASYNVPSTVELRRMIALHQKYASDGLVTFTLSEGPTLRWHEADLKHLQRINCPLPNYSRDPGNDKEKWLTTFDCPPHIGILLYGRDGKQSAVFHPGQETPPYDPEMIEKAVQAELKRK